MKKIPTVFVRDEQDRRRVTSEVTLGCEWALNGEGQATRKYDGTCCMLDEAGEWWARREIKPGKPWPDRFKPVTSDEVTGKTVGWVPMLGNAFERWHTEALNESLYASDRSPGTFELCGPKINGDPERLESHCLIRHADAERLRHDEPFKLIQYCAQEGWEGVVWHHPDGRMAKLKVRDYDVR